jgi:hypothetical protein
LLVLQLQHREHKRALAAIREKRNYHLVIVQIVVRVDLPMNVI